MSTILYLMGGVGGSACRRRLLTRLSISRLARINIVIRVCSVRIKAVPELEAGEDFRCCSSPAGPPEPVIVAVTPEQQQLRLRCEGVRVTLLFDPPEPTRIRMVVKEDSEVVLNCSASGSVRDQVFDWKKDDDVEVFLYSRGRTYGSGLSGQSPQFAGRVAHFPEALDLGNASIRIKKAEVRDSGNYTCRFPHSAPVLRSEISLVVGACPKPHIRKIDQTISRELWECEVEGAHPRPAVQWQDSSGRVLPAQETESEERDGRFYITVRANVSRSGDYSCVVTQEEFCHQINSTTFVYIGACSKPHIRIVDGGPDRELWECEVKGAHPRPAVQWQDSSGRVLPALDTKSEERDGRFYVTVRANVSRSGDYSCVVTPKEACRENEARTFVNIGLPPDTGSSTGRDAAIGVLAVLVVVLVFVLVKRRRHKGERAAASNKSTANACTPAPEERLGCLKNQAPGSD